MKYTFHYHYCEFARLHLKVGDRVLVYSRMEVLTGKEFFYISARHAECGYPGNLDSSIRRFHGWCGTTNNMATYAYGVYTVKSVTVNVNHVVVKINRTDLAKNCE